MNVVRYPRIFPVGPRRKKKRAGGRGIKAAVDTQAARERRLAGARQDKEAPSEFELGLNCVVPRIIIAVDAIAVDAVSVDTAVSRTTGALRGSDRICCT